MTEEATLDAFVREDDSAAADVDADESRDVEADEDRGSPEADRESPDGAADPSLGGDSDAVDRDSDAVEPAPVTSSWLGDAGTCSACGEPAGRLWTNGGVRVCTACKPWTRSGEDACDQ